MCLVEDDFLKLPKGDVHNHLHLGANRADVKKKYGNIAPTFPLKYKGLDGMISFIQSDINRVIQSKDDIIFLMENAIETCINDNVVYLEASIDIGLSRFFDDSIDKLISTVAKLKEKYSITFKPDIGINKNYDSKKIFSDGIQCVNSNVFNGIDIYGQEKNQKLERFVELFQEASTKKIKKKVHIGEFSSPNSIEETINLLKPDEIQHGIRASESENTMQMLLGENIQLNVCPQSNIALGAVSDIKNHPIRKLYDYGIKITINTDDFLLFNTSLTTQYSELVKHDIFTLMELDSIRKNSLDISSNNIN